VKILFNRMDNRKAQKDFPHELGESLIMECVRFALCSILYGVRNPCLISVSRKLMICIRFSRSFGFLGLMVMCDLSWKLSADTDPRSAD
jgi:hypothetical protein